MNYKVSLSNIFKEQLKQIAEFDTFTNSKKVSKNPKQTLKDLEKMEKLGITIHTTKIKSDVYGTKYTVVYKVTKNQQKKLTAKKIIRHK